MLFIIFAALVFGATNAQINSHCFTNYTSSEKGSNTCCYEGIGKYITGCGDCISVLDEFDFQFHTYTNDSKLLNEYYPFLQFDNICCRMYRGRLCVMPQFGRLVFRVDLGTYLTHDLATLKAGLAQGRKRYYTQQKLATAANEHSDDVTVNEYYATLFSRIRDNIRRIINVDEKHNIDFIELSSLIYSTRYLVRRYEMQLQIFTTPTFTFPYNKYGNLPISDNASLDFTAFFDPTKTLNETVLLLSRALLYNKACADVNAKGDSCWWLQAVTVDMWLDAWTQYYARHFNPFFTGKVEATTLRKWLPFTELPVTIGQVFPTGSLAQYYIFPQFIQNHVQHLLTDSWMPIYLCGLFITLVFIALMWGECLYCPSCRNRPKSPTVLDTST